MDTSEIRRLIYAGLCAFVELSPMNALAAHGVPKMYEAPLMGTASANDPLFLKFLGPDVVGPDHLLPQEWLPGAKSVLSYFLPFTKEIRDSNRKPGFPSEEWLSARIDGEAFNNAARAFLVDLLKELGADAVAPCIDSRFHITALVSNWSERHAAYAAGLGTFGLHRALITKKGSAGRFGSVVTSLELPPDPRAYTGYNEYCLYYAKGTCGACIRRCPAHAITEAGKDHQACSDYIDGSIRTTSAPRYGCGKCNVGVPCEYAIPV